MKVWKKTFLSNLVIFRSHVFFWGEIHNNRTISQKRRTTPSIQNAKLKKCAINKVNRMCLGSFECDSKTRLEKNTKPNLQFEVVCHWPGLLCLANSKCHTLSQYQAAERQHYTSCEFLAQKKHRNFRGTKIRSIRESTNWDLTSRITTLGSHRQLSHISLC